MERPHDRLGPFEIRAVIGTGGMGVVYGAWDTRLRRQVAIKTLQPALAVDAAARERFLREARAAAAVSHPNVTQIHDIGEDGGAVWFAMEYLAGRSLEDLLAERTTLDPALAVSLARQAAAGLEAAAARGIVHRDVKPSNLFLTADGTLKVTDFGLAKQLFADSKLTSDGQFFGTPSYIAPEQASGGRADARSDIYSLGATLYEMVAGRPPFRGASPVTVVMQHLREPVPPVRGANPAVPPALAALIHRMLSKNPAARPQSYAELRAQLDRVAESLARPSDAAPARAPAAHPPQSGAARRPAARMAAWAALGLLALVAVGAIVAPRDEPAPAPVPAPRPAALGPTGGQAELSILRPAHERTSEGLLRVHGGVRNAGSAAADAAIVRVVLQGADGRVVESLEVPVLPVRLEPGADGTFEAFFRGPAEDASVVLELSWQ